MPSGDRLIRLARAVCAPDLVERVIVPTVADLQHERRVSTGRRAEAAASLRGYAAFWTVFAWCGAQTFGRALGRAADPASMRPAARAFGIGLLADLAAMAALALRTPADTYVFFVPPVIVWMAVFEAAPAAVALAMIPATIYGRRRTGARAGTAVLLVTAGVVLNVVLTGWMLPLAQRWRLPRQDAGTSGAAG